MKNKNNGFTLVEVLAVIVVLGFVSLIVIPDVLKSTKNAKEELYNTQIGLIKAGAVTYITDLVAHPSNFDESVQRFRDDIINNEISYISITLAQLETNGAVDIDVSNPLCTGDEKFFNPNYTVIKINYDGKDFSYDVCSNHDPSATICSDAAKKELRDSCTVSNIN